MCLGAARIQSAQANSGGDMTSGGFAARVQGAADRNVKSESPSSTYSGDGGHSSKGQGTASSNTSLSGSEKMFGTLAIHIIPPFGMSRE
ncbi:unnamed protein product [Penicillium pancosmium]